MKKHYGFSLIESIVVMSIACLLLTIGTPTFTDIYQSIRADSQIRRLQQSLSFARNHAISYGTRVTMCPLINEKCHRDWSQGYSIFIDRELSNAFGDKDVLLYQSEPFNHKDTVTYNRLAIRFQADGLASGTNGTLKYCPDDILNPYSRAVIINQSGRVRFSKKKQITCD